jgi:hypothetical protein
MIPMATNNIIASSGHETHLHDKYQTVVYNQQVVIKPNNEIIRLDVFDIKSLMENLFMALNKTQKKNMIQILRDEV